MGVKVCKFGGTSMSSAESIIKVENIVKEDDSRSYIVVSAPGKRFSGDVKITDLLYRCFNEKRTLTSEEGPFAIVKKRYEGIRDDLHIDLDLNPYFNEIEEKIKISETPDYAASRGEYLMALLLAKRLGYTFVDAAEIIKFNLDESFNFELTNDIAKKYLSTVEKAVIPGFYGSFEGKIKTFSRGGSDITGAIIARAVNSEVYENWTDVNGFFTADPRLVKEPLPIDIISYKELRELSYMGAEVLHPDSIFPVRSANIPINIRNTFEPENFGTLIVDDGIASSRRLVTGIAGRKGFSIIYIEKSMMNSELGFCRKVLSVLEQFGVSLEHMPTGIDTLSLVVSDNSLPGDTLVRLVRKIRDVVDPDAIDVTRNLALIAVVGKGMASKCGTAARVCRAMEQSKINIKLIDQGSTEMNIIIGIDETDYLGAIGALYHEFF